MTSLLVSIHDVTAAHEYRVRRLMESCRASDVQPALLVVPNWHGLWPLTKHRSLVSWLRAEQEDGSTIVLHGERHDEHGLPRRAADHLRAFGRTDREGEFLTLSYTQAAARIGRGLSTLREAGLAPLGFIPPAWLASPATYLAAADAGLAFTEDASRIVLLAPRATLRSPTLRWSARTPWRAIASVAMGQWRARQLVRAPVARMALHPTDLTHPWTSHALRHALPRWATAMQPATYHWLVDRWPGIRGRA